jgi:hypothetical protein
MLAHAQWRVEGWGNLKKCDTTEFGGKKCVKCCTGAHSLFALLKMHTMDKLQLLRANCDSTPPLRPRPPRSPPEPPDSASITERNISESTIRETSHRQLNRRRRQNRGVSRPPNEFNKLFTFIYSHFKHVMLYLLFLVGQSIIIFISCCRWIKVCTL